MIPDHTEHFCAPVLLCPAAERGLWCAWRGPTEMSLHSDCTRTAAYGARRTLACATIRVTWKYFESTIPTRYRYYHDIPTQISRRSHALTSDIAAQALPPCTRRLQHVIDMRAPANLSEMSSRDINVIPDQVCIVQGKRRTLARATIRDPPKLAQHGISCYAPGDANFTQHVKSGYQCRSDRHKKASSRTLARSITRDPGSRSLSTAPLRQRAHLPQQFQQ
jgi:hypothetical protein